MGWAIPTEPVVFLKPDSALLKNNKPFFLPGFSQNIHYEVEQSKLWGMYWGVPDHNDLRYFNVNDSYSNYNCLKFTSLEDAKKVLDVVKAFDDMLSDAVKTIIAEY